MIIARHSKYLSFILLLLAAGLACNFPGLNQNQSDLDGIAPITTDDSPPPPPGSLPDFVVDSISIESTTIVRGAEPWTWITFQVTNIGPAPSPEVVEAHMTVNGEKSGGYFQLENCPLLPGESTTHQFAMGHNDTYALGSQTLVVIVDYFDAIEESNEDNNSSNPIVFEIVAP
jgi:hypothetical protein